MYYRIPEQSQLYLQYIKESTWEEFKGSVVKSLKSSKDWGTKMGAASEGRSNWTRWPPHQAKSYSSWTKWPHHQIQSYSTSTRLGTAATCFSLLSDKVEYLFRKYLYLFKIKTVNYWLFEDITENKKKLS